MRKLLIASLLVLAAPAANAIPVRYDFSITLQSFQGNQPGTGSADGSGFVVFDSDLAALGVPGGRVGDMNTPLPTLDLSFDWLGMHFDETNGTLGALYLDSFGAISSWSIDGIVPPNSCGDSFQCVQWGTSDFNLLGSPGGGGLALLTQAGVNGVAVGNVSWRVGQVSAVPEPGTLGLMLLGIAGAALRRRKASHA